VEEERLPLEAVSIRLVKTVTTVIAIGNSDLCSVDTNSIEEFNKSSNQTRPHLAIHTLYYLCILL
jgi:hypothetical protein